MWLYYVFQFDKDLRRKWEQAQDDGHFRYKLDIEDTKIFGENKYIAQVKPWLEIQVIKCKIP